MNAATGCRPGWKRALAYAAVLYAGFAHNALWVPDGVVNVRDGFRTGHVGFDSDLVMNRLTLDRDGVHPFHPLDCHDHHFGGGHRPYKSQFGLSGVVLAAVYRQTGGDVEAFAGRAGCGVAGLTALVLAAFFLAAARRVGPGAADVAVVCTACTPILLPFATSLYWAPFLLFAPLVATWLLEPRCGSPALFAALMVLAAGLACLKCLCGYEYVSTVILGPAVAVVYHRTARGERLRRMLGPAALLTLAGCVGFVAAFGLHAAQLAAVTGDDATALVAERASGNAKLTEAHAAIATACLSPKPSFLPAAARVPAQCLLNYYWEPAVATPTTWGPAARFAPFGLVVLAWLAAAWSTRRLGDRVPPTVRALVPAGAAAFLASLAWHLPALGHTCAHQMYSLVTFVPFLLFAYTLGGWWFARLTGCWGRAVPWLFLAVAIGGNVPIGVNREAAARTADERAAEAVAVALRGDVPRYEGAAVGPALRFDRPPANLESEAWSTFTRMRTDFDTPTEPTRLINGWWVGAATSDAAGRGRLVVVAGGRVIPARVGYYRITLMERLAGGKASCTGFAVAVAERDIPPGESPRLMVATGPEPWAVAELPGPRSP